MFYNDNNKNSNDMKDKIFKILRENKVGHAKAHYIKNELLILFGVSFCSNEEDDKILEIALSTMFLKYGEDCEQGKEFNKELGEIYDYFNSIVNKS